MKKLERCSSFFILSRSLTFGYVPVSLYKVVLLFPSFCRQLVSAQHRFLLAIFETKKKLYETGFNNFWKHQLNKYLKEYLPAICDHYTKRLMQEYYSTIFSFAKRSSNFLSPPFSKFISAF